MDSDKRLEMFKVKVKDYHPVVDKIPKGYVELKYLPNGIMEDSRGRRYWVEEDGSYRRVK